MPRSAWKKWMGSGKAAIVTMIAVVLAYLIYQIIALKTGQVTTIPVELATVKDSIYTSGYIVRDEAVITRSSGMSYTLLAKNGEKVAKKENIAVMYSSDDKLKKYIAAMTQYSRYKMMDSIVKNNAETTDITTTNIQIYNYLYRLAESSRSGMSNLDLYKSDLEYALLSREFILEKENTFLTLSNDNLTAYQNLLKTAGTGTYIKTKESGYFSVTVDGYENLLTIDKCLNTTTEGFNTLIKTSVAIPDEATLIGKLISGYEWIYAAALSESEAGQLVKDKSYKLLLRDMVINAVLVSVGETYDGKVLCCFKSGDQLSKIVSMRVENAEIVLNEVSGYRIPKTAIRMQEDVAGVFCLEGIQCVFKPVEIIFERDNYYIVKADLSNNKGIYLNDQLIINKKNLQDGMILQ